MENNDEIKCPLVNAMIQIYECIENQAIAEDEIIEDTLPERFKIDNWKEICKNCQYHENE